MGIPFDQILESIGSFGRYQLYNALLFAIPGILIGGNVLASVFLSALPTFYCKVQNMPSNNASGVVKGKDLCFYTPENTTGKVKCTEWTYDQDVYGNTLATEWNLVCDKEWLAAMTQAMFMSGFLLGCIGFGTMSDKFGRKITMYTSLILSAVTGSIAAFMPNFWWFVTLRLLLGVAVAGIHTTTFVMTLEITGAAHRTKFGTFYQVVFMSGPMLLSLVAYFVRDFKHLQLCLGATFFVFLPYWCLIPESARWLLAKGRTEEALREIERAAKINKMTLSRNVANLILKDSKEERIDNKSHTIFDLLRTPNMRKRTLIISFIWFALNLAFYGVSLSAYLLPGGPYLNVFITGLLAVVAICICGVTMNRIGRRKTIIATAILGGLMCLSVAFLSNYKIAMTVVAVIAKFGISVAYSCIHIYTAELYPTVVRNLGVGIGSMCARLGSITAPFVIITKLWWKPLPLLVFGCLALVAGVLVVLLPETLHKPLPESLLDGEHFGNKTAKNVVEWNNNRNTEPHDASTLSTIVRNDIIRDVTDKDKRNNGFIQR